MTSTANQSQPASRKRKTLLSILFAIFFTAGIAWAIYWFMFLQHTERTDDAYVAGNIIYITPQLSGTITSIHASSTDKVFKNQTLVTLDTTDAKLALDKARTALAETVREIASRQKQLRALQALVEQRKTELKKAQGDLYRRQAGSLPAISREEKVHVQEAVSIATAALKAAEEQANVVQAQLLNTPLDEQPQVIARAHAVREAWLNVMRCDIKSPVDGYVVRRLTQLGSRVNAAAPIMAIIPLHDVWVDANFKEVQIQHMRIGQPATITADFYGNTIIYNGTITGFAPGTGSSLSLLPPENATGNWIKVVQRLPVKIQLNPNEVNAHPLRVGLSCTVKVVIDKAGIKPLETSTPPTIQKTTIFEYDLTNINADIAAIIAKNSEQAPDENTAAVTGQPAQ